MPAIDPTLTIAEIERPTGGETLVDTSLPLQPARRSP